MVVIFIVYDRIKYYIENICKGNFEIFYLKNFEEVNNILIFKNLYGKGLDMKYDLY